MKGTDEMTTRMMFARGGAGVASKIVAITTVLLCVQVGVVAVAPFFPRCVEKAVLGAFMWAYEPYLILARRLIFNVMGEQQGNILLGLFVIFLGMFLYSVLAAVVICMVSCVLRRLRHSDQSTKDRN